MDRLSQKLGEASNLPWLGQRHLPLAGGPASHRPHAEAMPASSGVAASQDAARGLWRRSAPSPGSRVAAGEGWGRSISVTCTEKEVLSGDRLDHLLSRRQRVDRGGTCSSPDVLSIISSSLCPRPPPASPGKTQTRDWMGRGGNTTGSHGPWLPSCGNTQAQRVTGKAGTQGSGEV